MPSISVAICSNFNAPANSGINWTNVPPTGCTIDPEPGNPWPFTAGPPIKLPSPKNPPATLKEGLTVGKTYCFRVSCCEHSVCVTIT